MTAIVVLGSANLDLVVRQPRMPEPGETIFGSGFATVPGGKGLNQAIAAARAGGDVAFLGAVGDDDFGARLASALTADGVDVSGLERTSSASGVALINVLDDGENSIVVVSGANADITALDDPARDAIGAADYLVAQLERPLDLVRDAFRHARTTGTRTVLTPAPARPLDDEILGLTDILIPNAGEACAIADETDEATAALTLSRRCGLVVMTRGGRGVLVARAGEIVADAPARPVEPVDTTAAGDTFAGVLIARLAHGDPLERALQAATVAASISVTREGASSSMPTWAEIAAELGLTGRDLATPGARRPSEAPELADSRAAQAMGQQIWVRHPDGSGSASGSLR